MPRSHHRLQEGEPHCSLTSRLAQSLKDHLASGLCPAGDCTAVYHLTCLAKDFLGLPRFLGDGAGSATTRSVETCFLGLPLFAGDVGVGGCTSITSSSDFLGLPLPRFAGDGIAAAPSSRSDAVSDNPWSSSVSASSDSRSESRIAPQVCRR